MPVPTKILLAQVRRQQIDQRQIFTLCTHAKDAHEPEHCWLELSDELEVQRFKNRDEVVILPAAEYQKLIRSWPQT